MRDIFAEWDAEHEPRYQRWCTITSVTSWTILGWVALGFWWQPASVIAIANFVTWWPLYAYWRRTARIWLDGRQRLLDEYAAAGVAEIEALKAAYEERA